MSKLLSCAKYRPGIEASVPRSPTGEGLAYQYVKMSPGPAFPKTLGMPREDLDQSAQACRLISLRWPPEDTGWSESSQGAHAVGYADPGSVCLCWGFTAQSTQQGHVERGQFT